MALRVAKGAPVRKRSCDKMRQGLTAIALGVLFGCVAVAYLFISRPYFASQQHERWFGKSPYTFYQSTKRIILADVAQQAGSGRVLVIGHSQVERMDVSLLDPRALNLGIEGDSMEGVLTRLPDYPNIKTAKAIIFIIGINDTPRATPKQVIDKAQEILAQIPESVPVVWSLILPTNVRRIAIFNAEKIRAVNTVWKNICANRPHCAVSDATSLMAEGSGQLRTEYDLGDGVHLSAAGYATLRPVLRDSLVLAMK
jgi:lysophospholipase L1-like esterase